MPYSTKDSSQLFRFTKNVDGSYSIITHASRDNCLIEVADASKENGAKVQHWTRTDSSCQRWNVKTESKPVATTTTTTKQTTTTTTTTAKPVVSVVGDVNKDGKLNAADLVLLEKWLLSVSGTTLTDWKAADLNNDGILDIFDLVLMRKEVIK